MLATVPQKGAFMECTNRRSPWTIDRFESEIGFRAERLRPLHQQLMRVQVRNYSGGQTLRRRPEAREEAACAKVFPATRREPGIPEKPSKGKAIELPGAQLRGIERLKSAPAHKSSFRETAEEWTQVRYVRKLCMEDEGVCAS